MSPRAIRVELDNALIRPSDVPLTTGDARRAKELLGWEPSIPWDTTLHDILADHRAGSRSWPCCTDRCERSDPSRGWGRFIIARLRLPDGEEIDREIEDHGRAVAILPAPDPERRLPCWSASCGPLRFSRADTWTTLEVPAGRLDSDDPEACARREAFEEVGLKVRNIERVAEAWAMPAVSTRTKSISLLRRFRRVTAFGQGAAGGRTGTNRGHNRAACPPRRDCGRGRSRRHEDPGPRLCTSPSSPRTFRHVTDGIAYCHDERSTESPSDSARRKNLTPAQRGGPRSNRAVYPVGMMADTGCLPALERSSLRWRLAGATRNS